jgi:Spy/CpxP family protein refolding chaperone
MDCFIAGWTNNQVAEKFNMKPTQVSIILHSPNFQHEMALRRARNQQTVDQAIVETTTQRQKVDEIIKNGTIKAAEKMCSLVDSEDESIARQSASDLLDRGGFPKTTKQESKTMAAVMVLDEKMVKRIEESVLLDED